MGNLKEIVSTSFINYAGAVLQNRALADVRDGLKPSARQIFYCMETDKFISSKPFKKTLKAIGSSMRVYLHGDSSCEGIIMRAGQPFAMRYPLVEVEGSYGNLMESGNWAAARYTSSRLSSVSDYLFKDINKNTINLWYDNYDDTEKYPSVLPTKGYYNLCNGVTGIGVGAASSIPQFNLKEMNKALVKLLYNPNVPFNEIYCAPDFATGGILLNNEEVKESLRNGSGPACRLRSVINYDSKDNCLIVTEIPYSVYTNTICAELESILESEDNPGIERFNDLTGEAPLIKIYLNKEVSFKKVIDYLYKNTSLQYFYKINFTMLDDGRFPKKFTFREALLKYLEHQKIVYRNAFNYDLEKIEKRLNIIEGLLIAVANIEEIVKVIKNSKSKTSAKEQLQNRFLLNSEQVDAILEMKLRRLTNLEVNELTDEKENLIKEQNRIEIILNDEMLFKKEIERDLNDVAAKFGDERRTKVLNLSRGESEKLDKEVIVVIEGDNTVKAIDPDKLRIFNKGAKGTNLSKEGIVDVVKVNVDDSLFIYDKNGAVNELNVSMIPVVSDIKEKGANLSTICSCKDVAKVLDWEDKKYFISVTKNGIIKRCLTEEMVKRNGAKKDIKIKENDELMNVLFADDGDNLVFVTENNKFLNIPIEDYKLSSPSAVGAKGTSSPILSIITAAKDDKILTYTKDGKGKFSYRHEFTENSKLNMGSVLCDNLIGVARMSSGDKEDDKIFISSVEGKCITIEADSVSHFSPKATGGKLYNGEIQKIVSLKTSK